MGYMATKNQRQVQVSPYVPDRTEKIGDNTNQASSADIGKPVKIAKDTVVLCGDGDEIYGFISSVEAGTYEGHSVGGVTADAGREVIAVDAAGGLAPDTVVVAGAVAALGTVGPPNVKTAGAGAGDAIHKWIVIGTENDPSQAGDEVLLRKL